MGSLTSDRFASKEDVRAKAQNAVEKEDIKKDPIPQDNYASVVSKSLKGGK